MSKTEELKVMKEIVSTILGQIASPPTKIFVGHKLCHVDSDLLDLEIPVIEIEWDRTKDVRHDKKGQETVETWTITKNAKRKHRLWR